LQGETDLQYPNKQPGTLPSHFFFCGAATQRRSWPPHSWGF